MLSVTVASTDRDLTTTSALKATVLGATATSTVQDGFFSDSIRRSSRWAESVIESPLTVQTYRETVAGYGRRSLMLSRVPIRGVLAIYDATDTGTAQSFTSTDIRVEDDEAGLLSRDAGFGWDATLQFRASGGFYGDAIPLDPAPMSGQEYKPWMVDYVAGWTYGGIDTGSANWTTAGSTSTGRTLPEDVEQAVLMKSQEYQVGAWGIIEMEKLGDIQTNYRSMQTDNSGHVVSFPQLLLEPYRRVV